MTAGDVAKAKPGTAAPNLRLPPSRFNGSGSSPATFAPHEESVMDTDPAMLEATRRQTNPQHGSSLREFFLERKE